ncbi:hypothetical protein PAPYR_273 [Paratrimastix pyriformis]|uniref:Uncharacterized protein n=1 Tax=Paratrimastix pyriformis TaxID=342808 RepID=A0ABQ8UVW4_9EUKA|nr:hypothetical protein PAPYR_273 [Paratrimastix pyriformis]
MLLLLILFVSSCYAGQSARINSAMMDALFLTSDQLANQSDDGTEDPLSGPAIMFRPGNRPTRMWIGEDNWAWDRYSGRRYYPGLEYNWLPPPVQRSVPEPAGGPALIVPVSPPNPLAQSRYYYQPNPPPPQPMPMRGSCGGGFGGACGGGPAYSGLGAYDEGSFYGAGEPISPYRGEVGYGGVAFMSPYAAAKPYGYGGFRPRGMLRACFPY